MDMINFNQPMQNASNLSNTKAVKLNENSQNCFFDDDWTGHAADAVGEAFSNMDDLLELFKTHANTSA